FCFFFQAEDGIRDFHVTGVQTCALPISRVIMESNPVGASCARVCPTIELCEGACVLNSEEKPIQIGHLQRYATDWLRESNVNLRSEERRVGKECRSVWWQEQ